MQLILLCFVYLYMVRLFIFLASLLGLNIAQCPPNPLPRPLCVNCVSLSENNPTVPNSQTRCIHAGETMTISSINIDNNATLLICGTLIFNGDFNLNKNGSQVIVTPTGSLYVTSSLNINSQATFINYGIVNVLNDLNINGSGSCFRNIGPSGVLTVGGNIVLNASAKFINENTNIQASSLSLNGNSQVCMTNDACFSLNNLTTNGNGHVIVGSGTAAISYTGNASLNGGQLTNTDDLYICQAPGATVNEPNNFGTQNVVSNCTSGCNVLSTTELIVSVRAEAHYLYARWLCQGCPINVAYRVSVLTTTGEAHHIGITRDNHLTIPTSFLPAQNGFIQITVLDNNESAMFRRIVYYDIKVVDKLIVYPTIVEREINVWCGDKSVVLELYDSYGRLIRQAAECGTWNLSDLPSGLYWVIGHVNGRILDAVRILKK
jgi:hypothetical protein